MLGFIMSKSGTRFKIYPGTNEWSPRMSFGCDQGFKGWCNGWTTSCRFNEDKKLPCLFGCSGERDALSNYLQCPHLSSLWSFITNLNVSEMPLIRWGLIDPCTRNLNAIACVFSGYHAVRRHFKTINLFLIYPTRTSIGATLLRQGCFC
jgi:hypothetical protein